MNNRIFNLRNAALVFGFGAVITGCTKFRDFGDTNVNPAATTVPIIGALLTNVESGMGGFSASTRGGLFCQYFSETQYTDVSLYSEPKVDFAGNYSGSLYDLQNIILQNPGNNMTGISRILKAYIFWTMTDRWGDIPYSQSLKGVIPGYDKQQAIYTDLFKELREAVAQLGDASAISGDIIYGGNTAKWKKLGNSLRMLLAIRLQKKDPVTAATEFKTAFLDGAGSITSNADNFGLAYPGGNFKNPWFNTYDGRKDYGESKTMTDLLAGLGDTRATVFGGSATSPGFPASTLGFPYGLTRSPDALNFEAANANTWARILLASYRVENSPLVIVGASHVLFAMAEAAERGWLTPLTTTDAQTFYETAINTSFAQWGLNPGTYATSGSVAYGSGTGVGAIGIYTGPSGQNIASTQNATTTTKLQRIYLQRYLALYPDGTQGWMEWRRTGIPDLRPSNFATNTSKQIPRRMVYGQSEYSLNPGGAAQGATGITGGDTQDGKVWLDQ